MVAEAEGASKRPSDSDVAPEALTKKQRRATPTQRSTYEEIVDLAYAAAEHEVDRSVLYEEHHASSDAVLVPASVHCNTSAPQARGLLNAAAVSQEFLWRWTPGTPFDFTAAAMKLCNELHKSPDLEAGVEAGLAFSLQRLNEFNGALGKRCLQDTSLRLQVAVPLDGCLLRDTVIWDVAQPYNTAELYASGVCEDLGLRHNWFCAIAGHVQQLLADVGEEFQHEGRTTLPLLDSSESGVVPRLEASPLAGAQRPQRPLSTPILPKVLAHIPPKPPQRSKAPKSRPPSAPAPQVSTSAVAQRGGQEAVAVRLAIHIQGGVARIELRAGPAADGAHRTQAQRFREPAARADASAGACGSSKPSKHGEATTTQQPEDVEMADTQGECARSGGSVAKQAGNLADSAAAASERAAQGDAALAPPPAGVRAGGGDAPEDGSGLQTAQQRRQAVPEVATSDAAAPTNRSAQALTEGEHERAEQAALDALGSAADDPDVMAAQHEWLAHPLLRVPEVIVYTQEHDAGVAWRKRMAALRRRWQVVSDVDAKRAARRAAKERAEAERAAKAEAERRSAAAEAKAKEDAEAAEAKQQEGGGVKMEAETTAVHSAQPPTHSQQLQRQLLNPPVAAVSGSAAWPRPASQPVAAKLSPEDEAKYREMLQERLGSKPPGHGALPRTHHAPAAASALQGPAGLQQLQQQQQQQPGGAHAAGQQNAPQ